MIKQPTISTAIYALGINGGWKIKEGKIVKWWAEKEQPSDDAIQAKLKELQTDYDAKQYSRDRQQEYPSIQECVHAILDDDLTVIQTKRKLIKDKYPKPE
jgi:hypothetical protein